MACQPCRRTPPSSLEPPRLDQNFIKPCPPPSFPHGNNAHLQSMRPSLFLHFPWRTCRFLPQCCNHILILQCWPSSCLSSPVGFRSSSTLPLILLISCMGMQIFARALHTLLLCFYRRNVDFFNGALRPSFACGIVIVPPSLSFVSLGQAACNLCQTHPRPRPLLCGGMQGLFVNAAPSSFLWAAMQIFRHHRPSSSLVSSGGMQSLSTPVLCFHGGMQIFVNTPSRRPVSLWWHANLPHAPPLRFPVVARHCPFVSAVACTSLSTVPPLFPWGNANLHHHPQSPRPSSSL